MGKSITINSTTSTSRVKTKGNNGKGARRRFWYKLYTIIGSVLCTIIVIRIYEYYVASSASDDTKTATTTATRKTSSLVRLPDILPKFRSDGNHYRQKKPLLRQQQQKGGVIIRSSNGGIYEKRGDRIPEGILNGSLHLIDIRVDHEELVSSNGTAGVSGIFCHIDWKYHKYNPSIYPMFKDLIKVSEDRGTCYDTRLENIPILPLVADLQEYYDNLSLLHDDANNTTDATAAAVALKIGGFVFHESRCGSTLVANLLATSYPERHRVYSESPPPIMALQACGENYEYCSVAIAGTIFRTVIYLMSRRQSTELETTVFFKIQSIGSRSVRTFLHGFPNTPWIFVYRDPIHVMMSHLKYGVRHANCVRSHRRPPSSVVTIVLKYNNNTAPSSSSTATAVVRNLSPEHYCAAHLASITESILSNYNASTGIVINYANLIQQLHTTIFPNHYKIQISTAARERMNETASKYSKGRGMTGSNSFTTDNQQKEQMANEVVKKAVAIYLQPSYQQLEQLAAARSER